MSRVTLEVASLHAQVASCPGRMAGFRAEAIGLQTGFVTEIPPQPTDSAIIASSRSTKRDDGFDLSFTPPYIAPLIDMVTVRTLFRYRVVAAITILAAAFAASAGAQERSPVDGDGKVVDFQRDIAPLFVKHCLECHGPEEAKNDFRVDEPDSIFSYVEPEDVESSWLYIDYLVTEDDDLLMPPRSHGGPLSPSELALVRLWIEEGATWPDDAVVSDGEAKTTAEPAAEPASLGVVGRVWAFQGFLHPATVHFPIALLLVGALFVVVGFKFPVWGTQIPMACLVLGALSAIGATMMGWSFAVQEGYGSWTKVDTDSEIFWHRWSAVIVTVTSTLLAIVAIKAFRAESEKLTRVWKVGLLAVAAMVGAVGHQGGELTYGKDFYPKAFRILLDQAEEQEGEAPPSSEASDVASVSNETQTRS
ncbi:MAG: c-type cytochrome domain-containing protein [Planctomycetota bacterium]